jgi:iron complex outermembrane receptor protein
MKMPKLSEISNTVTRSVVYNTSTPITANQSGYANLKPEHSVNFEAVMEHYLAQRMGVLSANFYARVTNDFTERRVMPEIVNTQTVWVDRPYNVGDALHWGFELDGKLQTDHWGWSGGTLKAHLTLPHARVDDAALGITRMAKDTPQYVMSMGWDQSVPKWQSNFGLNLQLSGRSETDVPGEQKAYTEARALMDAFWLYKVSPKFNLRVSAQNILDEDTRRYTRYVTPPSNEYQLISNDYGYRTLMVTLEGRW